ncbi:hypothetical protein HAX54_002908 [Datura stramonium]|uniref:Uncharacterized protein n=1 Tax=Datura stramonium TaxID=4076 RepID=A0ABS8WU53_DATST|nr:hypothetical protein [Datura stramonium]
MNEGGSIRYSRRPMAGQRFPQSLKYERLQRVFRNKMSIIDPKDVVVITGQYPMYFTANGLPMYGETLISDDESLSLFLRTPDIFRNHISITTLDIYAVVECSPVIPEINDNEFDFGDNTYLPGLNTGLSRSLTEIFNNDLVIVQQDASDSDIHSNHGLIEDDHSSDNEDVVNVEGEGHSDQNVNYHSIAIPYLDSTEESAEDFACMRDMVLFELHLGIPKNLKLSSQNMLLKEDINHWRIDMRLWSNAERELAEEWIQISIESMTAAFLSMRLSFAPEYIPPNEYVDPPVVQNCRRERQVVPRDREQRARRAGGGRGGRRQADHHLVDKENIFAGAEENATAIDDSDPSMTTPEVPYYLTFDFAVTSTEAQSVGYVTPPAAVLGFAQI